MSSPHLATIRRHCSPLKPLAANIQPVTRPLRGLKAVLFDIYGTLFISASGDVGTAAAQQRGAAFQKALQTVGLELRGGRGTDPVERAGQAANHLIAAIQEAHSRARGQGIEYPEVDILAVWHDTLQRLCDENLLVARPKDVDLRGLAVEYEMRTNPTWPMPGAEECLHQLAGLGLRLGVVSNAQFFTQQLFPALLNQTAEALGFEPELQLYSFQWGRAKPGLFLYERAAEALSESEVDAHEVLYVGNDMLNDMAPARRVGFHTALFAGDKRSLRLREDDPRAADIMPDVIVTQLAQLNECVT